MTAAYLIVHNAVASGVRRYPFALDWLALAGALAVAGMMAAA